MNTDMNITTSNITISTTERVSRTKDTYVKTGLNKTNLCATATQLISAKGGACTVKELRAAMVTQGLNITAENQGVINLIMKRAVKAGRFTMVKSSNGRVTFTLPAVGTKWIISDSTNPSNTTTVTAETRGQAKSKGAKVLGIAFSLVRDRKVA